MFDCLVWIFVICLVACAERVYFGGCFYLFNCLLGCFAGIVLITLLIVFVLAC